MNIFKFSRILLATALITGLSATAHAQNYYPGQIAYSSPSIDVSSSYNYIYYPSQQVYFSPVSRLWFWNDGYSWRSHYRLPINFEVNLRLGGIPIRLNTPYPFREHVYVENYYGKPWRNNYYNARHFSHDNHRENYDAYDNFRERREHQDHQERFEQHDRNQRSHERHW